MFIRLSWSINVSFEVALGVPTIGELAERRKVVFSKTPI
jgi:hypothetical protein